MKLFQLHYFCTACAYRSVTRAAEALHVSQPAVSMAIQALENEFGVRLLDRGERGFVLTPDGEFFCREARAILSRTDLLAGAMEERRRLGAASLRFGSTPMAGAGFTQDLFRALGAGRSPLSVNLVEGGRPRLLQLLDDGGEQYYDSTCNVAQAVLKCQCESDSDRCEHREKRRCVNPGY